MVTFTHRISDPNGLHARSAAYLAKFGMECPCRIRVACRDGASDMRQLMGLMRLRAKCGDVLDFQVEGLAEAETAEKLKALAGELL